MSIEHLLQQALSSLGQSDPERLRIKYAAYLHSEMFDTAADLKLAVDDRDSWSDLKLPGRLKLEMKRLLQSDFDIYAPSSGPPIESTVTHSSAPQRWRRCFSTEYDSHYYVNPHTNEAQWEEPDDECEDDNSTYYFAPLVADESDAPLSPGRRLNKSTPRENASMDSHVYYASTELNATHVTSSPPSPARVIVVHDAVALSSSDMYSADSHESEQRAYPAEEKQSELTSDQLTRRLCEMGFKEDAARVALQSSGNSLAAAAALLVADAKPAEEGFNSRSATAESGQSGTSGKSGKIGLPRLILGISGKSKAF